jgi:hypothetical protein
MVIAYSLYQMRIPILSLAQGCQTSQIRSGPLQAQGSGLDTGCSRCTLVRSCSLDLETTRATWMCSTLLLRGAEEAGAHNGGVPSRAEMDSDHAEIWSALGHGYAVSGNKPEARKILAKLQDPAALSYVAPYNVAVVYAGLGEDDAAFIWLERAFSQRSYYLPIYLVQTRASTTSMATRGLWISEGELVFLNEGEPVQGLYVPKLSPHRRIMRISTVRCPTWRVTRLAL